MFSPQQAQVKIGLMESAVLMAHIYSPTIAAGTDPDKAEGIVATQVERWYQWLLQAYKDETVFHTPDAPSGVAPVQGTALIQALIAAIPGLDPATKALLGGVVAPLVTQGAAAVVQAAKGAIPLPPSSVSP